jgi:hypothetical protein
MLLPVWASKSAPRSQPLLALAEKLSTVHFLIADQMSVLIVKPLKSYAGIDRNPKNAGDPFCVHRATKGGGPQALDGGRRIRPLLGDQALP